MRRAGYKQVVALMLRRCVKQGLASGLASCLGFALAGGFALAERHSLIQNLAEAMKSALCEQNLLAKQA